MEMDTLLRSLTPSRCGRKEDTVSSIRSQLSFWKLVFSLVCAIIVCSCKGSSRPMNPYQVVSEARTQAVLALLEQTRTELEVRCTIDRLAITARSLLMTRDAEIRKNAQTTSEPICVDLASLPRAWKECIPEAWKVVAVELEGTYYTNAGKLIPAVRLVLGSRPVAIVIYSDVVPDRDKMGCGDREVRWAPGVYIVPSQK